MKNYFLILLLCQVSILADVTALNSVESIYKLCLDHEPPEKAFFHKSPKNERDQEIFVNLKINPDPYLANKNLPVWIAEKQDFGTLERLPNVMNKIGEFSFYQDLESCSAAVYFHKRRRFDGSIDNRYIINHVPYDIVKQKPSPSKYNIIRSMELKHPEILPDDESSDSSDDSDSENPSGVYEDTEQEIEKAKRNMVKSRLDYSDTVYIEILVIVNYDIVEQFEYDYAAIVSSIITTFNSADMLYAKLSNPKIKLNIAGIILGDGLYSFSALLEKRCYHLNEYDKYDEMDAGCIARAIRSTLKTYKKSIPFDSYDVVVFLTNYDLSIRSFDRNKIIVKMPVDGIGSTPEHEKYMGYKISPHDVRIAVVTNSNQAYQSFPVIAHELAHLFNVLHDQGKFRKDNGECDGNIMRTDGTYCKRCLSFAGTTIAQLNEFFGSRDACIFHNKPRSLYEPKPQYLWSANEQCLCYGYESAYDSQATKWGAFVKLLTSKMNCQSRLKCSLQKDGKVSSYTTAYLMDGTLCDKNKVCWNRKCKTIID